MPSRHRWKTKTGPSSARGGLILGVLLGAYKKVQHRWQLTGEAKYWSNNPRTRQSLPSHQVEWNNKLLTTILDTQASCSFISDRLKGFVPTVKWYIKGVVQNMRYNTEGNTTHEAKCCNLDIEIPVSLLPNLIPDIILDHDFLKKYGVILDHILIWSLWANTTVYLLPVIMGICRRKIWLLPRKKYS